MLDYVDERVGRLPVRLFLYIFGCTVGYFAVDLRMALLSFIILISGDLLDCFVLRTFVRPWTLVGSLQNAQITATATSAVQGISLVLGVSVYYFTLGDTANILFVFGAIGIGAVNAAIALPKNPIAAISRLVLYAFAPVVFMGIQAYQIQSWDPFLRVNIAGFMLVSCMFYMFFAFTKSGLANFAVTQDLERQRAEMKTVTTRMARHQMEMRQLSLVARNANDSVIISDKNRRIVWVNEAFTRVTGFSFSEAQGAFVGDLLTGLTPEFREVTTLDLAVESEQPFRGEVQTVTKWGTKVWMDINLFPVRDDDGHVEYFISIERDVTAARALSQEMAKAREAAEEGARAKADFLANMSHEIRTPLTGVVGMADLLVETELNEEQSRFAETIRGSSMSLMAIVNDILDLSKLDAGKMDLHPVNFSPRTCLQETIELLRPTAHAKGLEIAFQVDPGMPEFVSADDGRIRQVVTNILGNAIKFTEEGSVSLRLSHSGADIERRLVCEVSDTGIGIPEEQQEEIFDHFTQAEAAITRKFGGTGLGLSITRHILDVMGGSISVNSKVGKGTTFRAEIPYECPEAESDALPASIQVPVSYASLAGLRVLIAEDNQTNRFLLEKYLSDLPIEVEFASDGVEAVELTRAFCPDLIFMDMSMPRKNGIDATVEIRAADNVVQPAIVALTAHAFDEEMQACLDAGMDDFLTKPIRKAALISWLQSFKSNGMPARKTDAGHNSSPGTEGYPLH